MIDIFKAVVLGIVEGVTEFLPISSTGHLIIMNWWGISFDSDFTKIFDVVIQLGAILAVVVIFWKNLWPFTKEKDQNKWIWDTQVVEVWKRALVGVLPAIVLGYFFNDLIEEKLFNPAIVAFTLVLGGLIILIIESRRSRQNRGTEISKIIDLSYKTILIIGLIQCLAMVPGVSRSAATIIGALLLGATRVVATEFSFFLAIPTMFAASGYTLLKNYRLINSDNIVVLGVGFITAFLVSLIFVRFLIRYIQKRDFKVFGYYRIVLGVLLVMLLLIG